jgi:flagellar biosynthesis protein FliQ
MTPQMALDLAYRAIFTAGAIMAPVLLTAMVMGVALNIVQTVTSIKDQSLTFVPKIVAAAIVIGFSLPWMIATMSGYFEEMYMLFAGVKG